MYEDTTVIPVFIYAWSDRQKDDKYIFITALS